MQKVSGRWVGLSGLAYLKPFLMNGDLRESRMQGGATRGAEDQD
jgi:hypothetical protein